MSYIDDFNNYLVHEKRFSSHTVLAYMNDLGQFYELLEIQNDNELVDINHRKMRSYLVALVDLELENTSVNRKLSSIKTFFRFLRQQGVLSVNPAIKIQSLKQKRYCLNSFRKNNYGTLLYFKMKSIHIIAHSVSLFWRFLSNWNSTVGIN